MAEVGDGEKELTPVTFRAMMTEKEKKVGKMLAAMQGVKQREFWEEAMRRHINRRNELEESGNFDRNAFYLVLPRDSESVGLYGDEGYVSEVVGWAEKDNVKTNTALYTALRRQIDRAMEKAGFVMEDMDIDE